MTLELVSPVEPAPVEPAPGESFYLIVADLYMKRFCVEGPMTDDGPWHRAVVRAFESGRNIQCGPKSSDRRSLSMEYQRTSGFGGCPPGSFLKPRE
jgi:hypothetical protein